jgi:hypothetical protein
LLFCTGIRWGDKCAKRRVDVSGFVVRSYVDKIAVSRVAQKRDMERSRDSVFVSAYAVMVYENACGGFTCAKKIYLNEFHKK